MGMSASQARLLELTGQQNRISMELTVLAARKMSITREARNISRDYNDALNSKLYKWSNGSGTYQALTYNTLMKPNSFTKNKTYLITDLNDRVVLDGTYAKYAERFSPKGQPGANWDGDIRLEILSELTGVDKAKLEKQDSLLKECYAKKDAYIEAENSKPDPKAYGQQQASLKDLIDKSNKSSSIKIPISSSTITSFDSLNLLQIGNYLGSDENKAHWKEAVEGIAAQYKDNMASGQKIDTEIFSGENGSYNVNWDKLLENLVGYYKTYGGEVVKGSDKSYSGTSSQIIWFNPEDYTKYNEALEAWNSNVSSARESLDEINSSYDAHFDAETENLIKFYDTMFSAIAENGWTVNYNVNDSEYLNNMLQNNQFMITTVERNTEYNEDKREFNYSNEYKSQLASQVNNLVEVNDNDIQTRALAIAEERKEEVNAKERKIDSRMTDLKTIYSANKEIIESLKTTIKDNIDRNLNLFS